MTTRTWHSPTLAVVMIVAPVCCLLSAWALPARAQSMGSTTTSSGASVGTSSGSNSSGSGTVPLTSTPLNVNPIGVITAPPITNGTTSTGSNGSLNSNYSASSNRNSGNNSSGPTLTFPGISASNMLGSYYINPLSVGLPNGTNTIGSTITSTAAFGRAIYDTTTSTSNATASASRGSAGGAATSGAVTGPSMGPRFVQSLGFKPNLPGPAAVEAQIQATLNSSSLGLPGQIKVERDGNTFILKGKAADENDRAVAQALIALTPGVNSVRNEIVLQTPPIPGPPAR